MKKIIGIVIASLVFCNIGYAKPTEAEILGAYKVKIGKVGIHVTIACYDGYKFIHTDTIQANMIQFFEERNGYSVPAKC